MQTNIPPATCAVSVIIAVFNEEKTIGECLERLLNQTFQDFEVIVVDDCSTDASFKIVKGYALKFNGRLMFSKTKTHSDSNGYAPRNVGLKIASGEYVLFMNSDDFLDATALETLYNAAKTNDADAVYTSAGYDLKSPNEIILLRDAEGNRLLLQGLEDATTLMVEDVGKNLQQLFGAGNCCNLWTRFVRRDLLVENKIAFPELKTGGDFIWVLNVVCHAKRFLRLPTPLYFCKHDSDSSVTDDAQDKVQRKVDELIAFMQAVKKLSGENKALQDAPDYCTKALEIYFENHCGGLLASNKKLSKAAIREALQNEFKKENASAKSFMPLFVSKEKPVEKVVDDSKKKELPVTSYRPQGLAISVIIPLYNSEKYISELLDSLLAQTFQNFEVIIVDDCSTDKSPAIVKSYFPKFDGRLKLYHMEANTGSGALPRNKGLSLSSGEYIFNMDNDDLLTKTALEELYTLAKKWDADVVYCERYYEVDQDGSNMKVNVIQRGKLVDKPTLEPEDMKERVQRIVDDRYWVVPWSKLIRRSLVVEHGIIFPALKISDDNIWNQGLLFYAKKFLRVPNMIYIYRLTKTSIMRRDKTPQVRMNFWLDPVLRGLKYLDDLMSKNEFFQKNPSKRYTILRKFVDTRFTWILSSSRELFEDVVYKTIKNEYGKCFGEYDVLVPCLCAYLCDRNKKLSESKKLLDERNVEIKRLKDKVNVMKASSSSQTGRLAISVVIPLYNAAEYVGECLDSLLNQTFQNFEVIVVDDCSMDDSFAIVKSYVPKFGGRLRLEKTEKNSGGGGYVPRNIGFKFAQGEYVYFVDADDVLLSNALEKFYALAEEHDTDVIYTAAHYDSGKATEVHVSRDPKGKEMLEKGVQDKPTLFVDKFKENLHGLIVDRGFSTPWAHFIRREFLIKNKIVFPEIPKAGDYIWAINLYCYARRFLRLPSPLYCYRRYNLNSVSQNKKTDQFSNWITSFAAWTKALGELSSKTKILKDNPSFSYEASKRYFEWCLNRTNDARKELSDKEIYEILYNEFNKGGDSPEMMMPFFLSMIDTARKERTDHLKSIGDLKKEITQLKKKA